MWRSRLVCLSLLQDTHNGHRDGLVRRCVAHSFPSTKRREAVSLRVETYRTEMGSLMAHVITFARQVRLPPASRSTKRYLLAAFSDASFSPRRVASHSPTSWAPSCSKRSTKHHQGVDCVATIHDEFKVVDPPVRRFSGEELEGLSCRPSVTSRICGPRRKSTFSPRTWRTRLIFFCMLRWHRQRCF